MYSNHQAHINTMIFFYQNTFLIYILGKFNFKYIHTLSFICENYGSNHLYFANIL